MRIPLVFVEKKLTLLAFRAMEDSEDSVPRVIQMPMSTVGKRSGGSNDIGGIQESEDVKDDEEMEVRISFKQFWGTFNKMFCFVLHQTEEDEFASPEQLADDLITLALLPNSRWQNLLHLDVIKARNKPKQEEIQKPKSAPFFLPTISGEC